jgi:cysteine desulfurase
MDWLYLDNNATTQPTPEVMVRVTEAMARLWANPSSVHRPGQEVRQEIELARQSVARLINARERDILFTSGGTEANNLALRGVLRPGDASGPARRVLITTRIEHSAVREPAAALEQQGVEVLYLPVDREGVVQTAALMELLADPLDDAAMTLVSVHWANNETGVIEPVESMAAAVVEARGRGRRVLFHVDATQAVGKLPVDVKAAGVDLLTLSSHKFHGLKGCGALYVRGGVKLRPQTLGGPQERDRRGGTENTAGILALGVAAQQAAEFVADTARIDALRSLRDQLEQGVLARCPQATVNSAAAPRLWNTTSIAFRQLEAEAILLGLSERGLCASAGAACSSGSLEPSPVLLAMGIPPDLAHGSVRFSLSRSTTPAQIARAVDIIAAVVAKLAQTLPAPTR